jgi:SAM-dependent methyltransferase
VDSGYTNCLICSGTKLVPLPRFTVAHLVRCASCSLVFAGRRPSDRELADHYSGYGTAWQDSEITRSRYTALLDSFEPYRESNRILDMGCGAGYFLEEAAKRGWEAYGSEFGELPLALSRQRGLTVIAAPLTAGTFPRDTSTWLPHSRLWSTCGIPHSEAAILAELVRPGGAFYCTTPNFNAASRHIGARWEVVGYPSTWCISLRQRWTAGFALWIAAD